MPARVGLMGGSFNPIHVGHLMAAEGVREALALERVVFVPARIPPHKPPAQLAPAEDRFRMVALAIADNPALEVSDIELKRAGPSYTVDTVRAFRQQLGPSAFLCFIIGADTIPELPGWRRMDEIAVLCQIVAVSRPDAPLARQPGPAAGMIQRVEIPLVDVSSTDIRGRLHAGRSIRYLVGEPVRAYVLEKGLYR